MKKLSYYHDEIVEAAKKAFEHIYTPDDVCDSDGDLFVWNTQEEPGVIAEVQGVIQVTARPRRRRATRFEPAESWYADTKVKVEVYGGTFNEDEATGDPYDNYYAEDELEALKEIIAGEIEEAVSDLATQYL